MKFGDSIRKTEVVAINSFTSSEKHRNSENFKNQYTYKLMIFTSGSATVEFGKNKYICSLYDAVFLIPGERYRVLNTHGGFSVVNIYFTFTEHTTYSYTFDNCFRKEFCTDVYHFDDIGMFNGNFVSHLKFTHEIADRLTELSGTQSFALNSFVSAVLSDIYVTRNSENSLGTKIVSYISQNCAEELSAEKLSLMFNRHPVHINRIVKERTGKTLHEDILLKKLERAVVYLNDTDMSITEIAMELYFFDCAHFTKAFKKIYGITPAAYRRRGFLGDKKGTSV